MSAGVGAVSAGASAGMAGAGVSAVASAGASAGAGASSGPTIPWPTYDSAHPGMWYPSGPRPRPRVLDVANTSSFCASCQRLQQGESALSHELFVLARAGARGALLAIDRYCRRCCTSEPDDDF